MKKSERAENPLVQETVVKLQNGEGMLQIDPNRCN